MSKITQGPAVSPHGLMKTSDNSRVAATPGSVFTTDDGRSLKYVLAGAVDLATGVLVQSSAVVANHQNLQETAPAAIGAFAITVTLGATSATLGQYSQGFLEVSTGTGAGQRLKIATNAASALSTTCLITLEDPFVIATDSSSRFNLIANPYLNVVVNPTTNTAAPIGTTVAPIPAGTYGYIQTGGLATVVFDAVGTTAVAKDVMPSTTVAGALSVNTGVATTVGYTANAVLASQYGSVYLQLP